MRWWRYRIGRWLVHIGINVMPKGIVRDDLVALMEEWAAYITAVVRGAPDRRKN